VPHFCSVLRSSGSRNEERFALHQILPTRKHGFRQADCTTPATLSLKIDKNPSILWPHKESTKIGDLDVSQRHLVVLTSDGKKIQSFWFRFSDYKSTDLCMDFDGYQGVRLQEKKYSPWCKCK